MEKKAGTPRRLDLAECLRKLHGVHPLKNVFLFGSRVHRTMSLRSDVDLLVEFEGNEGLTLVGPAAHAIDPYLDIFVVDRGTAISAHNFSKITARSRKELLAKLAAVRVWKGGHFTGAPWTRACDVLGGYNPPPSGFTPVGVDLLLVTALEEEQRAMAKRLSNARPSSSHAFAPPHVEGTINTQSGKRRRIILVTLPRMGNIYSALTAARAIKHWSPRLVLLVGITGGVKDPTKKPPEALDLGDVIVADLIVDYESTRIEKDAKKWHGETLMPSGDHLSAIRQWGGRDSWQEDLRGEFPKNFCGERPRMILDAMASGQKVIADLCESLLLRDRHRKVKAVEMESLGVAIAARHEGTPAVVVKAISDLATSDKDDGWHERASYVAASFVHRLVVDEVL